MPRPVVRNFGAAAASALLLALPYHFGFLWPLAFFAFVPYFFSLQNKTRGQAVSQSYLFGVLFFGLIGYWLNYVNVVGFAVLTLYLALYPALFGWYASRFFYPEGGSAAPGRFKTALYLAAAWTLLEWARSWIISGLPWALLGYGQWKNLPFIQIADVTGVWGVSFAVMAANFLLYQFLRHKKSAIKCFYAFGGLLAALYIYGFLMIGHWSPAVDAKPSLRVSVVQGNIPQDQKWDTKVRNIIFEKYKRLTLMGANDASDLVVWPETAFPGFLEDEPVMAAHLRSTVRQSKTPVLVGAPTLGNLEGGGLRFYNSVILFGPNGEEGQRYSKLHLVPFGEYVPFEPLLGFIRHFVHIGHFSPGREKTIFVVRPRAPQNYVTARFAALICYEDIFPGQPRDFVRLGADFLVNVTNDAWFGKTSAPYQHAQGSVFRAVENRVPVVRATNTGLSCFIAPTGEVTASVEDRGQEIMVTGHKTQGLYLRKAVSVYNRFGDWFLLVCAALLWLAFRERHSSQRYSRL